MSDSLRPHGLYSPWNSPGQILEWVGFPFSRVASQLGDQTQVSRITGGFFTSWALMFWTFTHIFEVVTHLRDNGRRLYLHWLNQKIKAKRCYTVELTRCSSMMGRNRPRRRSLNQTDHPAVWPQACWWILQIIANEPVSAG